MAIKTAVLGYGLSGSVFHLPQLNLLPEFEVVKVMTSRKEQLAQEYPKSIAVSSIDDILNDSEIQLVINTLPNHMHYEVSKQCLEAGKHVVVEKPLVVHSKDGIDLIETAQKHNVTLTAFHNRRWDYDFLILKEVLKDVGNISLFESNFDRFNPQPKDHWREGSELGNGVLYDLGPHLIDQSLYLFGNPKEIYADLQIQRKGAKNHDYFEITLYYENFRAVLRASKLISKPIPSFQVFGDKGHFSFPAIDPQEDLFKERILPGDKKWDQALSEYFKSFEVAPPKIQSEGQLTFYRLLADTITQGKPVPVDPKDAVNTMKLIELAIESSEKGQRLEYRPLY